MDRLYKQRLFKYSDTCVNQHLRMIVNKPAEERTEPSQETSLFVKEVTFWNKGVNLN